MASEIDTFDEDYEEPLDLVESQDRELLASAHDAKYSLRRKIEERLEQKRFLEEFGDL